MRINRELGTTIIMTEHRLEDVLPVCNRSVVMENGRIIYDGDVRGFAESVRTKRIDRGLYLSMPASVQIYMGLEKIRESSCLSLCRMPGSGLWIMTGNLEKTAELLWCRRYKQRC